MRQIRERDLVAGKVLLLGKHPLVALESLVQLRQEGLDALVIGFALALHGLPDLFVGELCNRGIKVGLFDGHGLLVQSIGFQIRLWGCELCSLAAVFGDDVLSNSSAF